MTEKQTPQSYTSIGD